MQNLPVPYHQKDKTLYQSITAEGALNYEHLYMSGNAVDEFDRVRGIPADDFNVFATLIFALRDRRKTFEQLRANGKSVRHIDSGTGPNLYTFIASLPYVDELIPIDVTPANVKRLEHAADGSQPLAAHWKAWVEIGAILYEINSPEELIRLDRERSDLYDQLRHYPLLNAADRKKIRDAISTFLGRPKIKHNPYALLNLEKHLAAKLHPRLGDILDDVAPLKDLVGTADIYTRVFFSESIDSTLAVVAHAEANGIQLAKEGAFTLSAHMSKTVGYKGFFTPEELASDPTIKLAELPATPAFFEALIGEITTLTNEYRILWEVLEDGPEERKMVRQGMSYSGAVILCGEAQYKKADGANKYENGLEMLRGLNHIVRIVAAGETEEQRIHCTIYDIGAAVNELCTPHFSTKSHEAPLRVLRPTGLD